MKKIIFTLSALAILASCTKNQKEELVVKNDNSNVKSNVPVLIATIYGTYTIEGENPETGEYWGRCGAPYNRICIQIWDDSDDEVRVFENDVNTITYGGEIISSTFNGGTLENLDFKINPGSGFGKPAYFYVSKFEEFSLIPN